MVAGVISPGGIEITVQVRVQANRKTAQVYGWLYCYTPPGEYLCLVWGGISESDTTF
jgi:hypothetical protein